MQKILPEGRQLGSNSSANALTSAKRGRREWVFVFGAVAAGKTEKGRAEGRSAGTGNINQEERWLRWASSRVERIASASCSRMRSMRS